MCWTNLKVLDIIKKLCPSQKTLRLLGVSSWLRACPSVSGPSTAGGPRNNVPAGPPLIGPEPVTQTLSCELNLIETLANCVFFSNIYTLLHLFATLPVTTATKWTFIFNASTVTNLSTQHYGAKTGLQLAKKFFAPPLEICVGPLKTIGHRPATRREGGRSLPYKPFSPPLEKSVGHSWKLLDIVWKIWAHLRKLFTWCPSWLRAWAKPSDRLFFFTNNRDVTLILRWLSTSCSHRNADWILSFSCASRYFVKSKFGYWHPLICSYEPANTLSVDFDLYNRHNQRYPRGQHYTALRFPLVWMFIENEQRRDKDHCDSKRFLVFVKIYRCRLAEDICRHILL